MLLAIDAGNTETKFGLSQDGEWLAVWRRSTHIVTGPETGAWLRDQAAEAPINLAIDTAACASVVPRVNPILEDICQSLQTELKFVQPTENLPFIIAYQNPDLLGADRIANVLGAFKEHEPPFIAVDIGTATTFDAVSSERVFLGGAIMPGPELISAALSSHTAQLPRVEIAAPPAYIGRSTEEALTSGIVHGYVGALEKVIAGMKQELGGKTTVLLTGGRAQQFLDLTDIYDHYVPRLTLEGVAAFATL